MDENQRQILEDLANLIESDSAPQSIHFGGGAAKSTVEAIRAALAAPPEGYVVVPIEVLELYRQMNLWFTPATRQQEELRNQLCVARIAMGRPT